MLTDHAYAELVSPQANEISSVHRWFRFKESFSAALVRKIINEAAEYLGNQLRLLDPFCGVGTTLLAAQQMAIDGISVSATGIEYNPFIHFVAHTKANWSLIDPSTLMAAGERALHAAPQRITLPNTDSILSERCISRHIARRIVAIRNHVELNEAGGTRNGLLLGVASAVESLSRTRKDGRALRLVQRARPDVRQTLWNRWQMIADDVAFMRTTQSVSNAPTVLRGDGRVPSALGMSPESYDIIVTSPPYPNNIDYTEVYKLELWLMGLVRTTEEFFDLRRRTFRSHPTTVRNEPTAEFLRIARTRPLRSVLWPLIERTSRMRERWRARLLLGYFEDLYTALKEYFTLLRPQGVAAFVVGNSLQGGSSDPYLIPTDLILAALARSCGFDVERAIVARSFKRRLSGNHFLRETIVIARKRNG
ncbi:MAG: hypothetical protein WAM82_07065 [Thermoanaerobaculia bacterium]